MGNREQVKNSIRGAAGGCNAGDGVLEGCAGKNLLRQTLPGHEFHNETAYCLRLAHLRWMSRGNASAPHRCDSKKLADHGHRVCGELTATRAGARTSLVLDFLQIRIRQLAAAVSADRLKDILNGDVLAAKRSWSDGTTIQND